MVPGRVSRTGALRSGTRSPERTGSGVGEGSVFQDACHDGQEPQVTPESCRPVYCCRGPPYCELASYPPVTSTGRRGCRRRHSRQLRRSPSQVTADECACAWPAAKVTALRSNAPCGASHTAPGKRDDAASQSGAAMNAKPCLLIVVVASRSIGLWEAARPKARSATRADHPSHWQGAHQRRSVARRSQKAATATTRAAII